MRINQQIIDAFLLGAGVGGVIVGGVTYWVTTRERRLISSVRGAIDHLALYHTVSNAQYRRLQNSEELVGDKEILAYYRFSLLCKERSRKRRDDPINKLRPATIAAEIIICERVFGLGHLDAIYALRMPFDDLRLLGQQDTTRSTGEEAKPATNAGPADR